jgi:hypothetical protein
MPVFTRGLAFLRLGAGGFIESAGGIPGMEIIAARNVERVGINGRKAVRLSRINPCAIYSEDMQASIEEAFDQGIVSSLINSAVNSGNWAPVNA